MTLLPDGVSAIAAALVVAASFFTSALTAAFGLGGGLALLAVMGAAFPPAAVIPVHGVAQLGSNAGRFLLQRRSVDWSIAAPFGAGAVLGAALGARVYVALPEQTLKAAVGLFILATVWGPKPRGLAPGPRGYFATGLVSSALSMFFGATGPIAAAMLSVAKLDRMRTVATHAAVMVLQHALKTIAFGAIGFAFSHWAALLAAIVTAGFLGTWIGTRALARMPEEIFRRGFSIVLTFFGFYLIVGAIIG